MTLPFSNFTLTFLLTFTNLKGKKHCSLWTVIVPHVHNTFKYIMVNPIAIKQKHNTYSLETEK